jgi:hypothetical protein
MVFQITKNTIMVHYFNNPERLLSAKSGRSGLISNGPWKHKP